MYLHIEKKLEKKKKIGNKYTLQNSSKTITPSRKKFSGILKKIQF